MRPLHPGEVLRQEFMKPMGQTASEVAEALNLTRTRIGRVVREETAATAETAQRLGRYFGTTPQLWLTLQSEYDLRRTREQLDRGWRR